MRAQFPVSYSKWRYFLIYERGIEDSQSHERYINWLERWAWWLGRQDLDWDSATAYDAGEFLALLRTRRNPWYRRAYSPSTIHHAVGCIRLAYDFLIREGVVASNPFALIRVKSSTQQLPVSLTHAEVLRRQRLGARRPRRCSL